MPVSANQMPSERPPLNKLAPDEVQLADLARFPKMTGWFKPDLLGKLLLRVIISDVFGQYADRRLIHAALDQVSKQELQERADLTKLFVPAKDGAVWLDYVADVGDGFDATYAIAYLLAQSSLTVEGVAEPLPRGGALIMGGDEVYPTAARDEYTVKLRQPYSYAFPNRPMEGHPAVLLLPGNHDWYDGLVNFLAIFCRKKSTPLGAWRTRQRRSYFAVKITAHWWVWCIDIALVRDMDQPQADYFVTIAEGMLPNSNIILCSAEPGWYTAEAKGDSYRTLSYAASIARNAKKDIKIPLVLSGDSHHYSRYSGGGTQYITSGGGGTFLHGTLELKDEIKAEWLVDPDFTLSLKTTPDEDHKPCDTEACYPSKEKSYQLLSGNWKFFSLNPEFSLFLGGLYALYCFVLTSLPRWDAALIIYGLFLGGFFSYSRYQEGFSKRIFCLAAVHAAAHAIAVLVLSSALYWLISRFVFPVPAWHWLPWLLVTFLIIVPCGGLIAGTLFGLNLLLTCRMYGINNNDAFSAMKLDGYRHFLRIRIEGDTLKVYPVAVATVPQRHEWKENPARQTDTTASVFIPPNHMKPHLIEGPIVSRAHHAPSTTAIKSTSEFPSEPRR